MRVKTLTGVVVGSAIWSFSISPAFDRQQESTCSSFSMCSNKSQWDKL